MRTRHPKVKINCLNCGKEKLVWQSRIDIGKGKFCSTSCGKQGVNAWNWNGGIKNVAGYKRKLVSDHPFADKRGYVASHRLVMEKYIGRYLTADEVIHHKDGNRSNNNISNLQLCANQSEHIKIHRHLSERPRFATAKVLA